MTALLCSPISNIQQQITKLDFFHILPAIAYKVAGDGGLENGLAVALEQFLDFVQGFFALVDIGEESFDFFDDAVLFVEGREFQWDGFQTALCELEASCPRYKLLVVQDI